MFIIINCMISLSTKLFGSEITQLLIINMGPLPIINLIANFLGFRYKKRKREIEMNILKNWKRWQIWQRDFNHY